MLIDEARSIIYGLFFSPHSRYYWLYLAIYFIVALIVIRVFTVRGNNVRAFLSQLFPANIYQHASFRMDIKFWLVSVVVTRLGVFGLVFIAVNFLSTALTQWANAYFPADNASVVGFADRVLFTLVSILVFDFGYFLAHRLSHKIPALWAFHQVHHAAEHLTPLTAVRFHPVDHIFTAFVGTFLSTLAVSVFSIYHGTEVDAITVMNISVVYFLFLLLANFRHSHIWIDYGKHLSKLFVSPSMHQIHHSTEKRHIDRNFGFIFSFWDALFQSQYVPERKEEFSVGLLGNKFSSSQSVFRHLLVPFVESVNSLRVKR